MLKVYKGTAIGIVDFEKEYEERPESLPSLLLSVFQTLELKGKIDKNNREHGLVKSRLIGWSNDIHNLTVLINIIKDILDGKYQLENPTNRFLYLEVLVESYFTNIRSAYDTLVFPVHHFLSEQEKKQVPKDESMNSLMAWAENPNNKGKIPDEILQVLVQYRNSLEVVRAIRDYFVHKGGNSIILKKESGEYSFSITKGDGSSIAANILGQEDSKMFDLLPYLKEITIQMLNFGYELGVAFCKIMEREAGEKPAIMGTTLVGVCIPKFKEFLDE